MKFKCIYSDLMDFTPGDVYEGSDAGYGGFIINNYYAEDSLCGTVSLDGYDTEFEVV